MRATEATNYNSRRTVNGILDTGSTPVYSIQENAQKQRVSGIFLFYWKRADKNIIRESIDNAHENGMYKEGIWKLSKFLS